MFRELAPQERIKQIREEIASEGAVATRAPAADASTITISLSNAGGKIALNWNNTGSIGRWEYVALYKSDTASTDPYGYLRNQWTYVESQSGSYKTGTNATGTEGPNYWIAYVSYDYAIDEYVILQTAGPSRP